MNQNDKRAKLEEFTSKVWDMYKHLSDDRLKLEDKLNYLLAINTLIIVGYLQLFSDELKNYAFGHTVPFVFLFFPVLLLFFNLFTRPLKSPWFNEPKHLIASIEEGSTYTAFLAMTYDCANRTWDYQHSRVRLILACLVSTTIALVWLMILYVAGLFDASLGIAERNVQLFIALMLLVGIGIMIERHFKKPDFRDRTQEFHAELHTWLVANPQSNGESDSKMS